MATTCSSTAAKLTAQFKVAGSHSTRAIRSTVVTKAAGKPSIASFVKTASSRKHALATVQQAVRPITTRCAASTSQSTVEADAGFADYAPKVAFFFPGQGAQSVGMAKEMCEEVPAAAELFAKASEILGYDLLQVCSEGPKERLNSTEVSQPAIYVASLAAVEKLRAQEGGQAIIDSADVACGLSLGEYTALAFAGAISFEDGLRVVKARGEAMQAAADAQPTGMVSVIGLSSDKVQALCDKANTEVPEGEGVQIANFLCNGNYAISGGIPGCDKVCEIAKPEFKARMTVKLAVAGAFHTEYMAPAVETLKEVLDSATVSTPRIPVVSNVDAEPHSDPDTIKAILARQVTSPVLWENTLETLIEKGLEKGYELGPGKVVAGIMKRVNRSLPMENIEA